MRAAWRWPSTWLCALVLVHLAWGIARIPGRVWERRLDDMARYRERGAARFFLDPESGNRMEGADAVNWLLANSAPESVVLWRGQARGAFELASGLLAPRWLVHADGVAAGAREHLGRPVAAGEQGVAVLVGSRGSVALEFR